MGREVETIYGCFRCGSINGPLRDIQFIPICGECGERAIVTFRQAMDALNEMWLKVPKEINEAIRADDYPFEEVESE